MGYFGDNECKADGCGGPAMDNGFCYHCGGQNHNGGASEGNDNAVSHGAYAEHNKLYSEVFSERECDLADRIFQDYHDLYQHKHGVEPPTGHTVRLFKIAVNVVTEMRVDNWYTEKPDDLDTGTPYINRETHISESGQRYYRYKKAPSVAAVKHLEGYNRKWLEKFDLLPEDESDLEGELGGLITILAEERA